MESNTSPTSSVPQERERAEKRARIAYVAMATGLVFYIVTIWLQVFIDTRHSRIVSIDAFSERHRHWRLRSSLVFLLWSAFAFLLFPFGLLGWLVFVPAWVWYAYRVIRGMLTYRAGRPPSGPALTAPASA